MSFSAAHTQGVTQVAFVPDGKLLATADLGGKMCVWDVHTGKLLHYYTPGTSILSLIWADTMSLYCGLGDGTIVFLELGKNEINLLGSWSHVYPVEHLALAGARLASGGHSEVYIWDVNDGDEQGFLLERELGQPVKSEGEEVVVTGLHWTTTPGSRLKAHGMVLIVTYMSHGIYLFESEKWTAIQRVVLNNISRARSSLSPDGTHIAISNLVYGFDIYDLHTGTLTLAVSHDNSGKEYPVPVLYAHGGRAIIGGSTVGLVNVWYIDCSPPIRMSPLSATGELSHLGSCWRYYDINGYSRTLPHRWPIHTSARGTFVLQTSLGLTVNTK
ncbi:WD40-repeat-containing domain protein [Trametes meyenii]|nr:WD40-repeat-containing domain protein [Trametes meyenii]